MRNPGHLRPPGLRKYQHHDGDDAIPESNTIHHIAVRSPGSDATPEHNEVVKHRPGGHPGKFVR